MGTANDDAPVASYGTNANAQFSRRISVRISNGVPVGLPERY